MKQGIANIWLLGMIVTFIALMVAYIATTINYSASFKMKNEMLSIIEKHRGITDSPGVRGESIIEYAPSGDVMVDVGTLQTINAYLRGYAYTTKGYCPTETEISGYWYGVSNLTVDGAVGADRVVPGEKYYYCFAKYSTSLRTDQYQSVYYRVRIFYSFDVPILSTFLSIRVDGISNDIYGADPNDVAEDVYVGGLTDYID